MQSLHLYLPTQQLPPTAPLLLLLLLHVTWLLQLVMSQNCTKVFVGDSDQHIYGFNNCGDALKEAAAAAAALGMPVQHFRITRSFRLGQPVTVVANRYDACMAVQQAGAFNCKQHRLHTGHSLRTLAKGRVFGIMWCTFLPPEVPREHF
jgi:hypothetical protein